ncbi:IQ domain-containing protein IQM3-like [Olea europaea var. sylvestris]|uniref:IQ domain-containing protein IQM3-like n=1 Tax=Olea europaea var. sylvestris TaxID=158386 RepID=UPI000C1D15E7|nr:IQ domain-containing protein IQM3-like [Olea europaea var. sylvestris]
MAANGNKCSPQRLTRRDSLQMDDCAGLGMFGVLEVAIAMGLYYALTDPQWVLVGKGLSIDAKANILILKHCIEAIDSRHRYGSNLQLYYKEWFKSSANQNFFSWLDYGDGKEVDLEDCPRSKLDQQCVKYLGLEARKSYEHVIVNGKILRSTTRIHLNHESPQLKYIFVVSTSKKLYIGEKKKGFFHHSSFLAGGAILTAGRLWVKDGVLKRISPSSGHYKPTEDSLERFLSILKENGVNLDEVQIRKANEDFWSP